MKKVTDDDFHITWESAVFIRIGNRVRERIDGPDAALAMLPHRWPLKGQSENAAAERRCVIAISNHGSPELARSAFVEAAVAAEALA